MTSYLVFGTGLGFMHYGIYLYIVYVTHSRLIVLYSLYRVNRSTNMLVVFAYITYYSCFASTVFGLCVGRFPTCGAFPTMPSAP